MSTLRGFFVQDEPKVDVPIKRLSSNTLLPSKLKPLLLTFTLALLPAAVFASTVNTQVSEHTLKNGMHVYVKVDKRAPVVVSQVWYKVGSAYETPGLSGIAHVMEHMMFQGSKKYPENQFMQIVANEGGELNAFTQRDFTVFYEELASDRLATSFKLEADRMQDLNLLPENFQKEIKVVMEERRLRVDDNPESILLERVNAAAHLPDPYHHDPIGWMSDLKTMTDQDVRTFYQTWYTPNNAFLVVVGNVKPKDVFKLAKRYFGSIKDRPVPTLKPQTPPPFMGEQDLTVNAPAKLPLLVMAYATPTLLDNQNSTDPYALIVLAGVLGGGDSSRLQRDIVRGSAIASSVQVDYDPTTLFDDTLMIAMNPSPNHTVAELRQALEKELDALQKNSIDNDELKRVKTSLISQHLYDRDDLSTQATRLGSLIAVGLPWSVDDEYVAKINAVTADQVRAAAQHYLKSERLTVGVLNPLAVS